MEATWQYTGQEPVKIKKFLQSLGMGHRLFNEIKKGQGNSWLITGWCGRQPRSYRTSP